MHLFQQRRWEGNIREMENIIIQGILFSTQDLIQPQDVGLEPDRPVTELWNDNLQHQPYKAAKEHTLLQFNRAYIGYLLSTNQGNVTQAARQGGLERQALQQIMRRYGIDAEKYRT